MTNPSEKGNNRNPSDALVGEAQGLLQSTSRVTEDGVEEARNRLSAALAATKESFDLVQGKVQEWKKPVEEVVRKNPLPAVGVAFGLGVLTALIFSRRSPVA